METDCKINLTDLQLRNLAEHIPPEKAYDLGFSLGLTKTDLSSIIQTNDPIGNTFRVLDCWRTNLDPTLIGWRNKVEGRQTELIKLKAAMKEHNLEEFISCIGNYSFHCIIIAKLMIMLIKYARGLLNNFRHDLNN